MSVSKKTQEAVVNSLLFGSGNRPSRAIKSSGPEYSWQTECRRLQKVAQKALKGDSNDAEHDALYEINESLKDLLGITRKELLNARHHSR